MAKNISKLIKFEMYLHSIVKQLLWTDPSSATDTKSMTLEISFYPNLLLLLLFFNQIIFSQIFN